MVRHVRWHHGLHGYLLHGLHRLALRHLVHLLRLHVRIVSGNGVVSGASEATATVASRWGHSSTTASIVVDGLDGGLRHVLRNSIHSAETGRDGDSLALAVSIDGAEHLGTRLVVAVSLVGKLR